MEKTIGIFETIGFAPALAAAEVILSYDNIEMVKIKKSGGGRISQFYFGEYNILLTAFDAAVKKAREVGEITSLYIVRNLNKNIEKLLFGKELSELENSVQLADKAESKKIKSEEVKKIVETPRYKDLSEEVSLPNLFDVPKSPIKVKPKTPKNNISSSTILRLREEALSAVKAKEKKYSTNHSENNPPDINLNKLSELNVHELRREARKYKSFPIQGRQISRANRKELLTYFKELVR